MYSNCCIEIFTFKTKVITFSGIFYETCSKKELFDSEKISAFNQLIKVRRMAILPVIFALKSVVRQVGSNIKKTCMLKPKLRLLPNFIVSLSLLDGLLLWLLLRYFLLLRFHWFNDDNYLIIKCQKRMFSTIDSWGCIGNWLIIVCEVACWSALPSLRRDYQRYFTQSWGCIGNWLIMVCEVACWPALPSLRRD